jgi:hypothetical protein
MTRRFKIGDHGGPSVGDHCRHFTPRTSTTRAMCITRRETIPSTKSRATRQITSQPIRAARSATRDEGYAWGFASLRLAIPPEASRSSSSC